MSNYKELEYSYNSDEDDTILFPNEDSPNVTHNGSDGQSMSCCRSNEFVKVEPGLSSGEFHDDYRQQHHCPVSTCNLPFYSEDELRIHLKKCFSDTFDPQTPPEENNGGSKSAAAQAIHDEQVPMQERDDAMNDDSKKVIKDLEKQQQFISTQTSEDHILLVNTSNVEEHGFTCPVGGCHYGCHSQNDLQRHLHKSKGKAHKRYMSNMAKHCFIHTFDHRTSSEENNGGSKSAAAKAVHNEKVPAQERDDVMNDDSKKVTQGLEKQQQFSPKQTCGDDILSVNTFNAEERGFTCPVGRCYYGCHSHHRFRTQYDLQRHLHGSKDKMHKRCVSTMPKHCFGHAVDNRTSSEEDNGDSGSAAAQVIQDENVGQKDNRFGHTFNGEEHGFTCPVKGCPLYFHTKDKLQRHLYKTKGKAHKRYVSKSKHSLHTIDHRAPPPEENNGGRKPATRAAVHGDDKILAAEGDKPLKLLANFINCSTAKNDMMAYKNKDRTRKRVSTRRSNITPSKCPVEGHYGPAHKQYKSDEKKIVLPIKKRKFIETRDY